MIQQRLSQFGFLAVDLEDNNIQSPSHGQSLNPQAKTDRIIKQQFLDDSKFFLVPLRLSSRGIGNTARVIKERISCLQTKIYDQQFNINVKKSKKGTLEQLLNQQKRPRFDTLAQAKMHQIKLKQKVRPLRQDLELEQFRTRLNQSLNVDEIVVKNYYGLDHPKTKQTQQYINDLRKRRKKQRKIIMDITSEKMQQKEQEKNLKMKKQEEERQLRKQCLKQEYEMKMKQRLEEKQIQRRKREQYREWIKAYERERPLEDEKIQEYQQRVILPQQEEYQRRLKAIRVKHSPIDVQQLSIHEQKYLEFKRDDSIRKQTQLQMRRQQETIDRDNINSRFFKGKYRYLVLENILQQQTTINPKQVEQIKRARQINYANSVREVHKQTIVSSKQNDLEQGFIRRVRNGKGSVTVSTGVAKSQQVSFELKKRQDIREEGLQNLRFLKNKIRQQVQKDIDYVPSIVFIKEQEVQTKKPTLSQLRPIIKRRKMSLVQQIHPIDPHKTERIQILKEKTQEMDRSIQKNEFLLKHKSGDVGQKIQNQLLQAVKAKIHIMANYD